MTKEEINDVLQASGLFAVTSPQDFAAIEETLTKLATKAKALSSVGRALLSEAAAQHLGTLGIKSAHAIVREAFRPQQKEKPKAAPKVVDLVQPWSEEVSGDVVAQELRDVFTRYLWLPEWAVEKLVLFTFYTYVADAFDDSPLLAITSAGPESGKSRVLDVLQHVVRKPWRASASTTAALVRRIDAEHPTVLFDEFDNVETSRRRDLVAILNSGHTRSGATTWLCVGDSNESTPFDVYTPKVVAGIGQYLPETTWSRCIVIEMEPQPTDGAAQKFVRAEVSAALSALASRLARWGVDSCDQLEVARPSIPDALGDRASDSWTPLLAIADILGADWHEVARRAATESSDGQFAEMSESRELLHNIRQIFGATDRDRFTTIELLAALFANDEWLWRYRGKSGLTPRDLARLLRPYKVRSTTVNLKGHYAKGYYLKDFQRAFRKHLRNVPSDTGPTDATAPDDGPTPAPPPVTDITVTTESPSTEPTTDNTDEKMS